jgi:hypothetical protein
VALCALLAAAHSQSSSVQTQMLDANFRPGLGEVSPGDPAVAGDSVVWWDRRGDRAVLVIASATTASRDLLTLRPRFTTDFHVAAFGDRAIGQAGGSFYEVTRPAQSGDWTQVRLAGGLLAQRELIADEEFDEEWGQRSHAVFRVSRPDGSAARRVSGQRWGGSWDFDGRRLAWVTQPCYQTVIRVWDVTTGRPDRASERCGVPRIRSGTVRLDDAGDELLFKATYPRRPARGCDGDMRAVIRLRRGGRRITETYELPGHPPGRGHDRRAVAEHRRSAQAALGPGRAPRPLHLQEPRAPQGHHSRHPPLRATESEPAAAP